MNSNVSFLGYFKKEYQKSIYCLIFITKLTIYKLKLCYISEVTKNKAYCNILHGRRNASK